MAHRFYREQKAASGTRLYGMLAWIPSSIPRCFVPTGVFFPDFCRTDRCSDLSTLSWIPTRQLMWWRRTTHPTRRQHGVSSLITLIGYMMVALRSETARDFLLALQREGSPEGEAPGLQRKAPTQKPER